MKFGSATCGVANCWAADAVGTTGAADGSSTAATAWLISGLEAREGEAGAAEDAGEDEIPDHSIQLHRGLL